MMNASWCQSWLPLIGRILLSAVFLVSGVGKVFAFSGTVGYVASVGLPFASILVVIAIAIEFLGGLSLLFGIKTVWGASLLAVFVLLTAILFHMDFANQAQQVQFLKNLAIAGGLLYVAAFGSGPYSVDKKMSSPTLSSSQPQQPPQV